MPQILKKRCKFTLRWLLDLGNTSVEQNLRLETLGYLLFIPAIFCVCCLYVPWLTFCCHWEKSVLHLMLITASGLSIFGPKVTRRSWVSTPNWVPSGLWSQWHNPLSLSPQIAENTLPRLASRFSKKWKCLQYPKKLYVDTVVAFRLA